MSNSLFFSENEDDFYTNEFIVQEMMGEVYVSFAKKPTAESKFLYTYDLLKKYNKLPIELNITNYKNNKKSRAVRELGNTNFKNKSYVSALFEYNKSVMTAKIDSPDYALALANRSAALYYLEEYDDCIRDIHRALAAKYPEELTYKLFEREGNCLKKMGKMLEAKSKFEKCLCLLKEARISKENKKTVEMQVKMFLKESIQEKYCDEDKKHLLTLLGGPNKSIPALSKFVQLKYSESMGRCLVVSSNINPGDVLAIEKPYTAVLRHESYEHNCRNCFKRCLSGIPCLKCTSVIYCDENCRDKSYKNGHNYECKILTTFGNWPSMDHMEHLSLYIFLTTVCKFGLEKYIATIRSLNADNSDPMMRGFNNNGKYMSDQFCSAFTLEGNETKRTISDQFIRHCYAAVIVSFAILAGLEISSHQLGPVGESLVHILCVVASNAHEITQPLNRKTWSLQNMKRIMPVASLLLPILSLLNHHCDPNVVRHNYNGTVVVRAIQPISKNSQLFDNYGKLYATHTKEERQIMLSNQYCFSCECKACEENWPMYDVLSKETNFECSVLTTHISIDFLREQSDKLQEIISTIKANKSDGFESLQFLYSHLKLLHCSTKKPWAEYCDCQETIKEVLYTTADKFQICD